MKVIISNSKLNSYGTRVITSGIDLTQYMRNPILLWMHNRAWRGTKDEVLPLGKVENIAIEGDNLVGELKFDEKDEFAMKIKSKMDAGIIKMVSPGLNIIELSEEPALLLQGQTRATITKSKLTEVSVVDIGGNDDALVLYNNGKRLELSAGNDNSFLPLINNKNKMEKDFSKIALALGLAANADEATIFNKIALMSKEAAEVISLRKQVDDIKLSAITNAVDIALAAGKITADKKEHFINLGKAAGIDSLNETLALMLVPKRATGVVNQGGQDPTGEPAKYVKLSDIPIEKLELFRKDNPEEYAKLYKVEYGINPPVDDRNK